MKIGSKLNNGGLVIASKEKPDYTVVLCYWGEGVHPYVTWAVDKEGNAYWGHYHKLISDAAVDFEER